MSKYEDYMYELENELVEPGDEAVDAALDAMAFVKSLHDMFKENGVSLPDEPDCNALENIIDGVHGELSAACLFLSENSFKNVPAMLRMITKQFEEVDKTFTDPEGTTGPSVPEVIRKGFTRLADRIEATRVQQQQMLAAAMKNEE